MYISAAARFSLVLLVSKRIKRS